MWTDDPDALVALLRRVRLWPSRRPRTEPNVVDATDIVMRALRLHRQGKHDEAADLVTGEDTVAVVAIAMGVACALLDVIDAVGSDGEADRFLDALQLQVRDTDAARG